MNGNYVKLIDELHKFLKSFYLIALHLSYSRHFEFIPQLNLIFVVFISEQKKKEGKQKEGKTKIKERAIFTEVLFIFHHTFSSFFQKKILNRWEVRAFSLAQTHCKVKHIFYLCFYPHIFSFSHIEINIAIKAQTRKSEL